MVGVAWTDFSVANVVSSVQLQGSYNEYHSVESRTRVVLGVKADQPPPAAPGMGTWNSLDHDERTSHCSSEQILGGTGGASGRVGGWHVPPNDLIEIRNFDWIIVVY